MPVLAYLAVFSISWAAAPPAPSEATGNPLFDILISFGPIGIVLVLGLVGQVWFKPSVDDIKADKKLLQAQVDGLVGDFSKTVIPALGASTHALQATAESADAIAARMGALESHVAKLSDQIATVDTKLATLIAMRGGGGNA